MLDLPEVRNGATADEISYGGEAQSQFQRKVTRVLLTNNFPTQPGDKSDIDWRCFGFTRGKFRAFGKIAKLLPPIRVTIKDVIWRLGILIAPTPHWIAMTVVYYQKFICILLIDDVIIGPCGYKFGFYLYNDHLWWRQIGVSSDVTGRTAETRSPPPPPPPPPPPLLPRPPPSSLQGRFSNSSKFEEKR